MKLCTTAILCSIIVLSLFQAGIYAETSASSSVQISTPQKPYLVYGYVYNLGGTPISGCNVVLTNTNTTSSVTLTSSSTGNYTYDLANMVHGYNIGNIINITANTPTLVGWNQTSVTASGGKWLNVTMKFEFFSSYLVSGYVKYSSGTLVQNANMTITDATTSKSVQKNADVNGLYQFDISKMPKGYHLGDTINVTANDTHHNAYNQKVLTSAAGAWINVTYIDAFSRSLSYVTVYPPSITLLISSQQTFYAHAYDTKGIELTTGVAFSWNMSGSIGSISALTGNSTTLSTPSSTGTGTVIITATYLSVQKSNTSSINVIIQSGPGIKDVIISPASVTVMTGGTQAFTAIAHDVNNKNITVNVSLSWSVSGGIGTVNPTSGLSTSFTASTSSGTGTVTVTALYLGVTKTSASSVKVSNVAITLDHVTIAPATASVNVSSSVSFTATAYDQFGNTITSGVSYQWSVTSGIGTLNQQTGVTTEFNAATAGTGTVSVITTYNSVSKTGTASLTVLNPNNSNGNGNKNTENLIFGLDQFTFFLLIAIIIAIVLIACIVAAAASRRKKKETPPFVLPPQQTYQMQQYMRSPGFYPPQQYPPQQYQPQQYPPQRPPAPPPQYPVPPPPQD